MMRSLMLAALLGLAAASGAEAEKVKITAEGISVVKGERRLINVLFDAPLPTPADVLSASSWNVTTLVEPATIGRPSVVGVGIVTCETRAPSGASGPPTLLSECPGSAGIVEIGLQLTSDVPEKVKSLVLTYAGPGGVLTFVVSDKAQLGTDAPATRFPIAPAKSKDADIYFKGAITKGNDADPTFDLDTYAGYMQPVTVDGAYVGRFGLYGEAKTKESARIDPNTLTAYLVYQRVLSSGGFVLGPVQTPIFNLKFAGWEFDRKGDQRNFLISPVFTVPIRLSPSFLGPIEPGLTVPRLTIQFGAELVKALESPLAPVGEWHTRGLVGTTFAYGYAPEKSYFHSIEAKASYVVRMLGAAEVFKDPRNAPIDPATGKKGDPVFELGSQPRHRAEASITYQPVSWVGLALRVRVRRLAAGVHPRRSQRDVWRLVLAQAEQLRALRHPQALARYEYDEPVGRQDDFGGRAQSRACARAKTNPTSPSIAVRQG